MYFIFIFFYSFIHFMASVSAKETVSLCMMVKDELEVIEETLLNLLPYIDRYDITDTGSTDGTPEIIESFMKRHNVPGSMYYTPWNGFGDYGNEVGSQTVMFTNCYGKADYIFKMDADDLVVGNLKWPENMNKDAYELLLLHESGTLNYGRLMLLSGSIHWRSVGPVHEYIATNVSYTRMVLEGDYHILSSVDNRRLSKRNSGVKKYENDAAVLQKALIEEPKNSRYQFYLAQSYRDADMPEKALVEYLKRSKMGEWYQEVYYSLHQAAKLKQQLNYSFSEIQEQYLLAYESHPKRAEPLYELSRLFRLAGRPVTAYLYAHAALHLVAEPSFLFFNRYVYEKGILDEICATAWYVGAYSEGLDACLKSEIDKEYVKKNIKIYSEKLELYSFRE
jgi:glycosyltransferase involved in cell wall biosynthesis